MTREARTQWAVDLGLTADELHGPWPLLVRQLLSLLRTQSRMCAWFDLTLHADDGASPQTELAVHTLLTGGFGEVSHRRPRPTLSITTAEQVPEDLLAEICLSVLYSEVEVTGFGRLVFNDFGTDLHLQFSMEVAPAVREVLEQHGVSAD